MNWYRLTRVSALLGFASLIGCNDHGHAGNGASQVSQSALQAAAPGTSEHLLVDVSYDNGVFRAEKAIRVKGELLQPRCGQHRGGLRFAARSGADVLHAGGIRDVRQVYVEYVDPATGQTRKETTAAPGKQHLLIHVQSSADAVDFYEAATFDAAVPPKSGQARLSAVSSEAKTIGSVSLKGLL
jgi:hypothetical protein